MHYKDGQEAHLGDLAEVVAGGEEPSTATACYIGVVTKLYAEATTCNGVLQSMLLAIKTAGGWSYMLCAAGAVAFTVGDARKLK